MATPLSQTVQHLWSLVASEYQPIVDLRSAVTVGFEALARWPADKGLTPDAAFATAYQTDTVRDLDQAAQIAAMAGAQSGRLPSSYTLFVNAEVEAAPDFSLTQVVTELSQSLWTHRVIVELTERALLLDPARVMTIVDTIRSLGFGIALDDVGSSPDSSIMLETVAPDVIKIDRTLTQALASTPHHAATVNAITAYRSVFPETVIVAEGIETSTDLARARALGATHGQGWFLGRPAALPRKLPDVEPALILFAGSSHCGDSGGATRVSESPAARVAGSDVVIGLTRFLEDAAAARDEPVVLLAAIPDAEYLTPTVMRTYSALANAREHNFVGIIGVDLPPGVAEHVRTSALDESHQLADSWLITVVSPNYAAALIARDLGDHTPSANPRYSYMLTHDRPTVIATQRTLMRCMPRAT